MNMMKYCPECYKEIPPESPSCPFCGYKTENDTEDGTPQILKTPKTDSYIPPEQTVLNLLLLLIFFWGINIAITVLPIFLDIGTTKNILIAAITSQVLTRALIGFWAFAEISLKKDQTTNKKIGAFLMTFIPIGAIFSFLHASKTMVRNENLSPLTISSIAATIIMTIMLYSTADDIAEIYSSTDGIAEIYSNSETSAVLDDSTPDPNQPEQSADITPTIPSPTATRVYQGNCRSPYSITVDDEGKFRDICGKVTNYGVIVCDTCPSGYYSYLKLDGKFQIISYEWNFAFTWLEKCVRVSDYVETLGGNPVFVYRKSEGCTGTECVTSRQGELISDSGVYFQDYFDCE
ncbi:MAG: hypothetical protein GQ562_09520 [Anaerolineales bacterium]|nr:hypothetical protein [Anaerolineales bacterium]